MFLTALFFPSVKVSAQLPRCGVNINIVILRVESVDTKITGYELKCSKLKAISILNLIDIIITVRIERTAGYIYRQVWSLIYLIFKNCRRSFQIRHSSYNITHIKFSKLLKKRSTKRLFRSYKI